MKSLLRMMALLLALAFAAAACAESTDDAQEDVTEESTPAENDADSDSDGGDADEPEESETVDLTQGAGSVLDSIATNGEVKCGTRDALAGFAVLQADGTHQGFDSDFCRAIAAGVLGDAEAVDHVDLETADRFTALQSGEVDVLVRNTTWTASRDGSEGATFLQPNFYDGQGMMVHSSSSYNNLADMDNTVVCVASGTTTEGNAADEFSRLGLSVEVLSFETNELIQEAFDGDRCDGWSADSSALSGHRANYIGGADAVRILPEVFSKEPLAPAVRDGDTQWAQAVNWIVFATIQAEEFGITSSNVDSFLTSENPNIQKFLGVEVDGAVLDPGLGLPTDFAYQVVKQVGNYGEIFDRHLTPLGLERGNNALWFDGGLLYAPPYR
ncbi:MAG: amino acid ABC transporter substrate-binding protein [Acidimicrobiales bacterium]